MKSLPKKLIEDLDSYLPTDPLNLISGYRQSPSWVHGDPTLDNVLLSVNPLTGGRMVQVIDFGDAGHGDPVYDFVAIAISTLQCSAQLLPAFWSSYRHMRKKLRCGYVEDRSLPLSKVANCYALLHEDDPCRRIFELRPELRAVRSLSDLQYRFWGFLDS